MIWPQAASQSRLAASAGSARARSSRTASSSGPPGSFGTSDATSGGTPSAPSTPAAIRIDSGLSTSAKFGTSGQRSLFLVLAFQPSKDRANGAVMAARVPIVRKDSAGEGRRHDRGPGGTGGGNRGRHAVAVQRGAPGRRLPAARRRRGHDQGSAGGRPGHDQRGGDAGPGPA